ncbi:MULTISPECIES: hypothetical protein [unclassified Mesorhizobium]|uniref:hypothetical protein n=1 Tax=unclassified Mesorhizobium TaxID=325217 RepID=UPI001127EF33|nr:MULTISPECIES: hypothetical protein [unclassified Mesorhizobium]TPJ70483.1 hypothetical protein FJ462_07250 [Mesorhizobium sp. B2-6-7]TPJ76860.1 hypothetical protein FJ422_29570 [Mesorhizobium sp. B2-6-3]
MSEPERYASVPKRGEAMSTSVAAKEAFELLNAATQKEWRGWGDTRTAARDRAAKKAGLTPAQAERLWKNWQTLKFPNGDVYRLLRNKYGHLCAWIENAADAMERERREIEENDATDQSRSPVAGGMARAAQGAAEREMR